MDFRITICTNNVARFSVPAGYFSAYSTQEKRRISAMRTPGILFPNVKTAFYEIRIPLFPLVCTFFQWKCPFGFPFFALFVSKRIPNSFSVLDQRHITAIISFVISFSFVYQSDINVLFASCNALIMDVFVILSFSFTIHSKIGGYPGSARIISNPLE